MMPGIQEFLIIVLVIIVLSVTGLWPVVIRALRELRGEHVETPGSQSQASRTPSTANVDIVFQMLGLSPSATWEEIERAYRQKAKAHHPDLGGDEDFMRALNEGYQRIKKARGR
jgi:hypothetical protein